MSDLNIERVISRLWNYEMLEERTILQVIEKALEIMAQEPTVLTLQLPCSVVGDIHGQFHDLKELFEIGGVPPQTNYVFLGDYVDRGPDSVAVVALLFSLKAMHPDAVYLIRGNHESVGICARFGLLAECKRFGEQQRAVFDALCAAFDVLPLAAVVGGALFCVHGGISPLLDDLDQLRAVGAGD